MSDAIDYATNNFEPGKSATQDITQFTGTGNRSAYTLGLQTYETVEPDLEEETTSPFNWYTSEELEEMQAEAARKEALAKALKAKEEREKSSSFASMRRYKTSLFDTSEPEEEHWLFKPTIFSA